jgi:hypothetical protein
MGMVFISIRLRATLSCDIFTQLNPFENPAPHAINLEG